jgi:hypothetical protein
VVDAAAGVMMVVMEDSAALAEGLAALAEA